MYNRGINQDDIQKMNRSLLLHLLQEEGECSRVHLANLTGLKQATITNIINDFIKWELVVETRLLSGNKGRRSIGMTLNTKSFRVLGVRLSRRNISVAIFDLTGKMLEQKKTHMNAGKNPSKSFEIMVEMITAFMEKYKDDKILAMGVAIPGPFLVHERRIILMTEEEPGWEKIYIDKELEEKFHIPVFLEHDADAGAFCQLWHADDIRNDESIIYLAVGQGIGAGIIMDGKIYQGALGVAGEIGHLSVDLEGPRCACGNRGCLEKFASSIAFTRAVNQRLAKNQPLIFEEVVELTQKGDAVCNEEYRKACEKLAKGLVGVVYILNPSAIIIGDDMAHVRPEVMLEEVDTVFKERLIPALYDKLTVRISDVGGSMLNGAGIIAINEIFNKPERFLLHQGSRGDK
ncbi:MAG: ROK family transcriptional regulator [Eubacteriales bacterium]|nr:ROK family transcriptional regulator [Eubacteriales bacterium]